MSEELTPTELVLLPIEDQISQELVKANVTEAIIADLRERLLPLKISGIDDKETYLIVQAGRKECKALRVAAKKICTSGRESAVAISKAWIAKEKEVTGQIGEVEDYLEKQENEFEAEVAKEKEARKRKQDEQLIMRQQILAGMGVLYADGNFSLGEVSFEFSLIKESDEDIWEETILPKLKEEYEKVQAEQIEFQRREQERSDEFKRQQEELDRKQKELADKEAELKKEADRQAAEAKEREEARNKSRIAQLHLLGLKPSLENDHLYYIGYDCAISHLDITGQTDDRWSKMVVDVTAQVNRKKKEEAEEKRKEQERKDLQDKRYAEMYPYKEFGSSVQAEALWCLSEDEYSSILLVKKSAYEHAEEEKKQKIADDAAKKERERIEEEQRQAEVKRKDDLRRDRTRMLVEGDLAHPGDYKTLGEISEEAWMKDFNELKANRDEIIRKQEEERKAEQLAQSTDKRKWEEVLVGVNSLIILLNEVPMRSGQYRKKAAILREKLEEIKAL